MKYAIVLKIINVFGYNSIVNTELPYLVPEGQERHAHFILGGQKERMVIIADKETLKNNPFDLYSDEDFEKARPLPLENVSTLNRFKEHVHPLEQ